MTQPSYAPPPPPALPPSPLPQWARRTGLGCGALVLVTVVLAGMVIAFRNWNGGGQLESLPWPQRSAVSAAMTTPTPVVSLRDPAVALPLDPEHTARAFLAAAGSGDYARAHDFFSEALKKVQPLPQFTTAVASNRKLFDVESAVLAVRAIDEDRSEVSGTMDLMDGAAISASFRLQRENGQWRLTSYQLGKPADH